MILVDTSVWIAHLRNGEPRLVALLEEMTVLTHPFVIGELALGRLDQRDQILDLLDNLPTTKVASDDEVLSMIEKRNLDSAGIGWVDAHLLAAALLSNASLWTMDRQLARTARGLDVGFPN